MTTIITSVYNVTLNYVIKYHAVLNTNNAKINNDL